VKSQWRRDQPQLFDVFEVGLNVLREPEILSGVHGSILSQDNWTSSTTYIARFPNGWRWANDLEDATVEFFILEGDLRVNGSEVGAGGYASIPQGAGSIELASVSGALTLFYWNPDMPLFPPPLSKIRVTRSWKEPWQEALGRLPVHGTFFKSLRMPDFSGDFEGGPGGFLRLVVWTPGNHDPRQHVHHECWEEMFVLRGDVFMPERGVLGPGSYLSNPQEYWHAPFASHGGCVMLIQTDGPMGPWTLRDYPNGDEIIEAYLDSTSWARPPGGRRWADMPDWAAWQERPEYIAWRTQPNWEQWSDIVGREMASKSRAMRRKALIESEDSPRKD
jgi:hypothetical protein